MSKLIQEVKERQKREGDSTILDAFDESVKFEYDDGTEKYMGDFADYHGGERQ